MKRERKCQKAQIDKTTADGMAHFWTQAIMFEKTKKNFVPLTLFFFHVIFNRLSVDSHRLEMFPMGEFSVIDNQKNVKSFCRSVNNMIFDDMLDSHQNAEKDKEK